MPTETELLAQKLRDVVEALIGADAALESRIAALENRAEGWFVLEPPKRAEGWFVLEPPKNRRWWAIFSK